MKIHSEVGKFLLICCLGVISASAADTITGTVHNQSTGQAAVGDDVILLRLGQGMQEEARTRTDDHGAFTLSATVPDALYIVRVMHQAVNYDQTIRGKAPLEIKVFDAVDKIPGLNGNMGIAQVESDGKNLKVTEMYSIRNMSSPPVTQAGARNFEITLPPKAVLDSVDAKSGEGVWVKVPPAPDKGRSDRLLLGFPLRPGDTLFKYSYHLPVRGATLLHLRLSYPIQRFAVLHAPSLKFKESKPGTFKAAGVANGVEINEAAVEPVVGDVPVFEVSGVGAAPSMPPAPAPAAPQTPPPGSSAQAVPPPAHPAAPTGREGMPVWMIVTAIVAVIGLGGFLLLRVRKPGAPPNPAGDSVQEALKEELMHLEAERSSGAISEEEYASAKKALDVSLQRTLARKGS